jgi:O-acetyl-ADP-ribose deacetylase (regulator of RNase III)
MRVSVISGDIADAPADAICTSTNPRLTLMMGTGGSVRERGGFEVLRAAEEILSTTGRHALPPGSVHVTTAGRLPYKAILHCVASDAAHQSSDDVIRLCVRNALAAAAALGCTSVAMPVFATGHAHFRFRRALAAMAESLRDASTSVERVTIVVIDPDRTAVVNAALREAGLDVE